METHFVYTFQIINNGNETATNVSFSDVFPTGYTINSISLTTPDSPLHLLSMIQQLMLLEQHLQFLI